MTAGVLLLAAGNSKRFGGDKRTANWQHTTILQATIDNIQQAGLPLLIGISRTDRVLAQQLANQNIAYYRCDKATLGMGATLAAGIALCHQWPATLIALGDMPGIQPETYQMLANDTAKQSITVPYCNGLPGNPVGFGKDFYSKLQQLNGDTGGKTLVQQNTTTINKIPVSDEGILWDIDTPEDIVLRSF